MIENMDGFERHLSARKVSPPSIRAYLADVRAFLTWFEKTTGEVFSPAAIVRRDVADWRDGMRATYSLATVNRRLSSLRAFYLWAQREGLASLNPLAGLRGVRVARPTAPLPNNAIEVLLMEVRQNGNSRDHALLELLADTGLRVAELASLQRRDLSLTEGQAWLTVAGKANRAVRRLEVRARARLAIRAYLEEIGEIPADGPLFSTRKKTPISPFVLWYTVRKHARLAGLGDVSPRRLREAAARRLIADPQIGLVKAAHLLGQERVETLVKYLGEAKTD